MLMYQPLINHIKRYVELNEVDERIITEHFAVKKLPRKAHILSEGEVCTANYFILDGLCRMYFIKESGQEQITQFGLNGWWIADYMSLEFKRPSNFFIQTIEETTIALLTAQKQELLFTALPKMERYFRQVMQRAYAASQVRIQYLFEQSAEERYRNMADLFPGFVQRVPQYMLASYLHITPEVLSKIRAKK